VPVTVIVAAIAILSANPAWFAAPLCAIAANCQHIEEFLPILSEPARLAVAANYDDLSLGRLLQMIQGLASFQKYMPTRALRTACFPSIEARPAGQPADFDVCFTDVAGFTCISEDLV